MKELCGFVVFLNNALDLERADTDEMASLLTFQTFVLNFPEDRTVKEVKANVQHDWINYFINRASLPEQVQLRLKKQNKIKEQDLIKWGYEAVWFGRRSQKYKMGLEELSKV